MKLYDECRDCLYNSQMKKVESVYGGDQRMQSFKEAVRALCADFLRETPAIGLALDNSAETPQQTAARILANRWA